MNVQRDPETILAAWLDDGPTDLPDATRRAIVAALPTTPQARRGASAPWRSSPMHTYTRLAAAAIVAVIAIGGALYLIGPRFGVIGPSGSSAPQETQSHPSPSETRTPPPLAGIITLTDEGCTWASNPGSLRAENGLRIGFRNDTDHDADFEVHWVRPGQTFAEGVAFVADLRRRLTTGEDWPPNEISIAVASHAAPPRSYADVTWPTSGQGEGPTPELQQGSRWYWQTGTYGIVCSANTSPTGDVLSTFLVGPLDIAVVYGAVVPAPGPETATWASFSSSRHGYTLRHPPDRRVTAASAPLTYELLRSHEGEHFLGGDLRFVMVFDEYYDTFSSPDLYPILGVMSTRIPDGMTEVDWLATYGRLDLPGRVCVPPRDQWAPISIDGNPSGLYWSECGYAEAIAFVAGRAYTFTVTRGMGGVQAGDLKHLLAMLSTVTFQAELADDSP